MPINIHCPHCRKLLKLEDAHIGQSLRCPACQETFIATAPEEHIQSAERSGGLPQHPVQPAGLRHEETDFEQGEYRRPLEYEDDFRGRPHRGGLILTLGILSVVFGICCPLICWILGITTLVLSNDDLKAMAQHTMDRSGLSNTRSGRTLAIVGLVISVINSALGVLLRINGVLKV